MCYVAQKRLAHVAYNGTRGRSGLLRESCESSVTMVIMPNVPTDVEWMDSSDDLVLD